MKAGIRTFLLADASVSGAVSGIYSFPAPQRESYETKPYILLTRISGGGIDDLITGSEDVYNEVWQIDIIGKSNKTNETVKELIITRMQNGNRVAMGNYWVYSVELNFVQDSSNLEDMGGERTVQRTTMDFQFKRNRDSQ